MKKLTTDLPGINKSDVIPSNPMMVKQGGCAIALPVLILIVVLLFSCTRKVHTEKTEDRSSDTQMKYIDSINQVNRTLSQAYEELLKTTNSTGVVFESQPCDTVTKVVNKIIVAPDGTKTFEGNIKSYKDDATKLEQRIFALQETNDSLSQLVKKDTSHQEVVHIETVRTVKSTFIPVWMWVIPAILFVLWFNERFRLFNIPFLTRKKDKL